MIALVQPDGREVDGLEDLVLLLLFRYVLLL